MRLAATSYELVFPLRVAVQPARREDLAHLEWFGSLQHHRPAIEAAFAAQEAGNGLMLLALANRFPVGQIWVDFLAKRLEHVAVFWAFRVLPPMQRLGLGSQLIGMAEREAAKSGAGQAEVLVEFQNRRAHRLYSRLGYAVYGRDTETYEYVTPGGMRLAGQVSGWLMRKALSPAPEADVLPPATGTAPHR